MVFKTDPEIRLTGDIVSDAVVHATHRYPSAPSVTLCVSILDLISDHDPHRSGDVALHIADQVSRSLTTDGGVLSHRVANRPLLVLSMIRQLLIYARNKYNKATLAERRQKNSRTRNGLNSDVGYTSGNTSGTMNGAMNGSSAAPSLLRSVMFGTQNVGQGSQGNVYNNILFFFFRFKYLTVLILSSFFSLFIKIYFHINIVDLHY